MARSIRFTQFVSRANDLAGQLQGLHFTSFSLPPESWQPAVNVYAYADRLEVCAELAGVTREEITVEVQERRLVISGHRRSPEPGCADPPCGRILIMEIAEGAFERILDFPMDVDTERVVARQENGWLWITLPFLKDQASN